MEDHRKALIHTYTERNLEVMFSSNLKLPNIVNFKTSYNAYLDCTLSTPHFMVSVIKEENQNIGKCTEKSNKTDP